MSVEQVARGDGTKVWRVRWRDEHGRNHSKTLGRKRDAETFDAEIRRLRRLGELGLMDAGRISLAEFGKEWLVAYAVPNLEPVTLRTYESLWDRHVLPNIGASSCVSCVPPCSTASSHSSSARASRPPA